MTRISQNRLVCDKIAKDSRWGSAAWAGQVAEETFAGRRADAGGPSNMVRMIKEFLKKVLPRRVVDILRVLKNWRDPFVCLSFVFSPNVGASFRDRLRIVYKLYAISFRVDSPHTQQEIISYIRAILALPRESNGVVVEAGCYKGGSTSKFSLAADIAGKTLVVFDSFQGIPDNVEPHERNIFGGPASFKEGDYCGALDEVKTNVSNHGKVDRCRFVPGWFDDTLPDFREPVSAVYLDVDLASSTRTCLKHLYPLLEPGGVLFSQDGHLPLVLEVFDDDRFWSEEVGCEKPRVLGLGKKKLIKVVKSNGGEKQPG